MNAEQHVPQFRFKGFSDSWEQRKLGEVAEFSKGNGYTKEDLTENGSPIILYGRLYTKYKAVINDVDTFVVPKDRSVISKGNEVIVPASGETAEDISRASVVGKSGFILGGDLNVIKPDILIDSLFLALTISNGSQQKEMAKRAQGKSVVHLHSSDLQQINLLYPKLKEQRKIGTFFKQLDDTITLHQRKLAKLKELKKGYLQKLFPQNSEKVPEFRFKGYSDAWEKRKLAEVAEINPKSEIPETFRYIDLESVKGSAIINSRSETRQTAPSRAQRTARIGDVFYQTVRPYQRNNVIFLLCTTEPYVFSSGYAQLRSLVNPFFILYLVQTDNFVNRVLNRATGTSYPAINPTHLSNIPVWIPQSFSEQKRVGQLLRRLDNLITAT
ncbi:restriction endonuclease subunit S [Lacticaseibacillus paracasei]|uniref:restriction endonuclease subunit S n=1 Tax=Lacticaseibacillus paracasei TaxID=1597 RepID=UPI000F43D60B|nr:restriction endonuclease subunit S [Lacticaseibacillus paracasei]RND49991.1 Type I restriction modification DNA specificity domain protein [Lacticaseibacillus paracasei]